MIRIDEEVEPVIRIPIELREQRDNKEPRVAYENTIGYEALQREIEILEAQIHYDIRNYDIDMSKELLADLKDLEKKCRAVRQRMKKNTDRNS